MLPEQPIQLAGDVIVKQAFGELRVRMLKESVIEIAVVEGGENVAEGPVSLSAV
jgi:hypothetical protein